MRGTCIVLAVVLAGVAGLRVGAETVILTANGVAGETLAASPAAVVPQLIGNEVHYDLADDSLDMAMFDLLADGMFAPTSVVIRALAVTNTGGALNFDTQLVQGHRPPLAITATNRIKIHSYTSRSPGTGSNAGQGGQLTLTAPDGITVTGLIDTRGNNGSGSGAVQMFSESGPIVIEDTMWLVGRTGNVALTGSSITTETIRNDRAPSQTVGGNRLVLTSTAGGISAGDLYNSGNVVGGGLALASTGGDIVAGRLVARSSVISQTSSRSGGTVDVASAQNAYVWSADVGTSRTNENNNRCIGGAIRILAQQDVEVEAGLAANVLTTSTNVTPSAAGRISVTSSVGNILIKGLIEAHAPAGGASLGPVSLVAPAGSITLGRLDFSRLRDLRLIADAAQGTHVLGPVGGLLPFLDKIDLTVGGFSEVTGDVHYQTNVAANAYLEGLTYEILNSVGGPFYLRPAIAPFGPFVSEPTLVDTNIGSSTATLGGTVEVTGGAPILERGIYWSTNANFVPPADGVKVAEFGSFDAEPFVLDVAGLPAGALIHYRAYASNSAGFGMSMKRSFVTRPPVDTGYYVDFEGADETKPAFGPGSVELGGLSWFMNNSAIRTDPADRKQGVRGARLRWHVNTSSNGVMSMEVDKTNGLGWLTFLYATYSTDTPVAALVEYSLDGGGSWVQAGRFFDSAGLDELKHHAMPVNKPGNVRIRFRGATGSNGSSLNIDNIELHDFEGSGDPVIPEPAAGALAIANGSALFVWADLLVGQSYRLEAATNLLDGMWLSITNFGATSAVQGVSTPLDAGQPAHAYRLIAE
ncbi:MAG TPA: hypothetical protein PKE12_13590 [Kiritimatiellia bacterium]|nr:hypothetical protein [Kiritimatiellia bacterium]